MGFNSAFKGLTKNPSNPHTMYFFCTVHYNLIIQHKPMKCWYQWPHGLKRRSAAARLLRLWVRIPPGAWMSVCRECCVLSGRGLCSELITRPEESYRLCCVVVCDLEISWMRRPWPNGGLSRQKQTNKQTKRTFSKLILIFRFDV